jgi:uncharacterized membrane protein YkvA (DUF1232 family)
MDTTQALSRALVPRAGQQRYVKRAFWDKVRRTLGLVPFLDRAIAAYYAALDPATPRHAKATLFAALAYFVLPADVIPDFVAGLGFTDDGAVLMMAIQALAPYLTAAHLEKARRTLAALAATDT